MEWMAVLTHEDVDREAPDRNFPAVYREWSRSLYGTALRLLRRPADAEDAVQEAFLRFCGRAVDLPAQAAGAWLHRVLVNECIDRVRSARRWRWTEIGESQNAATGQPSLGVDLGAALDRLPQRAREVFLLHDVEGFRHREIAGMLQISEGTSKSQLFRARELMRAQLDAPARGA